MALFKSVDNIPNVDMLEYRDKRYFNNYDYKIAFKLQGVGYTWNIKTGDEFRKKVNNNSSNKHWFRIPNTQLPIIQQNLNDICHYIDWKNDKIKDKSKKITFRQESNNVSVFSNEIDILLELKTLLSHIPMTVYKCNITQYTGIKYFANEPKYKFRVYFKSKHVDARTKQELKTMISSRKELFPGPGFKAWLNENATWYSTFLSGHHHINFNDESMLTILLLTYGELIGKSYKLEKHPEL